MRSLVAEAYREAVLRGINMTAASEALEAARLAMRAEGDLLVSWAAIDLQVNLAADVPGLQSLLIGLREHWQVMIYRDECDRLKQTFERDPDTGWTAWLVSFSSALTEFRLDFCLQLCDAPLPFRTSSTLAISQLRLLAKRSREGRWAEVFEFYLQLSEELALPPDTRATTLCLGAEVIIYYLFQYDRAKAILEKAQDLAITERVAYVWGIYYIESRGQDKLVEAKQWFQRAVELRPDSALGYIGIGQCLERENDLPGAEEKYRTASRCACMASEGYLSLLRFCGEKSSFEARKGRIPDLVKRLSAVPLSGLDTYSAMVEAGYAYQLNSHREEAHQWNRRAIDLDPNLLRAYVAEGYLFLEENDYPNALSSFQKAIKVAPEAMEGYWGASWVSEEQKNWSETLRWLKEALRRRGEWSATIHARMGRAHLHLKEELEAAKAFLQALVADPATEDAVQGLETLAADRYKRLKDPDGARHLYSSIRAAAGDSYEGTYRNLLGHLHYYSKQYREAADEYRLAIAANPKTARFYSNFALAIERLITAGGKFADLDQAIEGMRQALELEPASSEYQNQLAKLRAARAFAVRCGERSLIFELENTPLRIFLQADVLPLILNEDRTTLSGQVMAKIQELRERVSKRFGLTVPGLNFRVLQTTNVMPGDYFVEGMEKPLAYGRLEPNRKFVFCSLDRLFVAGLEGIEGWSTISDEFPSGFWIKREDWERASAHDLALVEPVEYLLSHIELAVTRSLDLFCGYGLPRIC